MLIDNQLICTSDVLRLIVFSAFFHIIISVQLFFLFLGSVTLYVAYVLACFLFITSKMLYSYLCSRSCMSNI